ncbi:MAG: lysine--tRNA ligase [Nanoarchaeota archaeon]|nr:lysine--tRNA ligase [Nanoarchaeota archaeon]
MKGKNDISFENVHWADNAAKNVIEKFPNEKVYTVASGITPSGIVHVGHFREIITSEFVRKALENKGKKTNFIYSWDSYDAFRKVPKNIPSEWEKYLRLPDADVPDPTGQYSSFAEKFMKEAEDSLEVFNFPITFQRQHELQTSGIYAEGIKKCLNKLDEIKAILNKFRDEDHQLGNDWMPLTVYSEKTGKDTTKILDYDGKYSIKYKCLETDYENTIDFRKTPIIKLAWRLDWPMRWAHYGVSYEPGGKDHSSPGSSYETGKEIVKLVYNREAPEYTAYNFVGMKGQGGKVSSSSGNGATVGDVLKVYTPEMVLFLFAGTRPNAEFDISFDLDIIKLYEDFDRLERIYFGIEIENNAKKLATLKRTYELSMVNGRKIPSKMPFQVTFRHLVNISQANDMDFEKTMEFYLSEIKTKFDEERFKERFECVKNWLEIYAEDDMKFSILHSVSDDVRKEISDGVKKVLPEIIKAIENAKEAKDLVPSFKELSQVAEVDMKEFFRELYLIIVGNERGPRLAGLMFENKEKIIKLLKEF